MSRDMLIGCSGTCLFLELAAGGHAAFPVARPGPADGLLDVLVEEVTSVSRSPESVLPASTKGGRYLTAYVGLTFGLAWAWWIPMAYTGRFCARECSPESAMQSQPSRPGEVVVCSQAR